MRRRIGLLGYPIPPWRHRFRIAFAVFLSSPSVGRLRARLILSYASQPLQSFSNHHPPGPNVRTPSRGFHPSSRYQLRSPLTRASHCPLRSVLDVSHVLDGLLLHNLRGFISPRNHVQGSLFRGFPRQEAVRARRSPLPSCRLLAVPALSYPIAPGPRARLQGLALPADPSHHASDLDSRAARSPLELHPPSGLGPTIGVHARQ
jgi:hypothetical protein